MKYARIVHDAWHLTLEARKLKWFAFVPAFVGVVMFILEVLWQGSLLSTEFGVLEQNLFFSGAVKLWLFISSNQLLGWSVFTTIFILLFAFVLPPLISSTLIVSIRQKFFHPEKYISLRQKIIEGAKYFFPLFQFHAMMSPFALITIGLFGLTMFRYFHGDIFTEIFTPLLVIYCCIALVINIFTAYTPFFVVVENLPVSVAIRRSIGMVFVHFLETMAIILIMFLVSFRIVVNVVVVLGVPFGIMVALSYLAKSAWLGLGVGAAVIVGLIAMYLASYLNAVVDVFSVAVWERAYHSLREKQNEMEVGEASEQEGERVS